MNRRRGFGTAALNAPYSIWAIIFIVVPLFIVAYFAFTDDDGSFTVANIVQLRHYGPVLWRSLWYSLVATLVALLISYPFSYFLSKQGPLSRRIQMVLVMVPMWTNLVIRTYSWTTVLDNNGLVNTFLKMVGLDPVQMIGTPAVVIFGMVYNYLPYMILPIYTVMSKIDPSLLEAAEDLGCNSFNKLRRVIMPLTLPGVVSGITMVFVPSISTFYISQQLSRSNIKLAGDIIERLIKSNNYSVGAALSLVLMVFIIISMLIMNKFSGDEGGMIV